MFFSDKLMFKIVYRDWLTCVVRVIVLIKLMITKE